MYFTVFDVLELVHLVTLTHLNSILHHTLLAQLLYHLQLMSIKMSQIRDF